MAKEKHVMSEKVFTDIINLFRRESLSADHRGFNIITNPDGYQLKIELSTYWVLPTSFLKELDSVSDIYQYKVHTEDTKGLIFMFYL